MSDLGTAAITAGISGGFGLVGSGLNYLFSKRLAEQQNQYNIDMWKMQAEYNSPQAQMQRFQEAGLNPNLIYGQGSNGNMSTAPQMVTPDAPDISRDMRELGKAFNIENLRTTIANRKKAQADAQAATIAAANAKDEREAHYDFSENFSFDPVSGRYVFIPSDSVVTRPLSKSGRKLKDYTGAYTNRAYYYERMKEEQYKSLHLIPYRAAMLEHQRKYLVPQITMANYEAKHFPTSYWIGQGSRIAKGVSDAVGILRPSNWLLPIQPGKGYYGPWSGSYYY